jgi:hypothetical protein
VDQMTRCNNRPGPSDACVSGTWPGERVGGRAWIRSWLTICVSALIALAVGCSRRPYSSPTALRNTNSYVKAVQGTSPGRLDAGAFDGISVSYETNRLTVLSPGPASGSESDGFAHAIKCLKPGEALKGENAVFEFLGMGIAALTNFVKPEGQIPLEFFIPDGRRLSESELTALGFKKWERATYTSSRIEMFPRAVFVFGSKAHPPGYFTMRGLFDARTQRPLTSGSSYSQVTSNYFGRIDVQHEAWHATPLELVLDVELDGRVTVETNLVTNAVISVPGGLVKIMGLWEGRSTGTSSYSGTPARFEFTLSASAEEKNSFLLFASEPPNLTVRAEGLDENGKVIDTAGGFGAGAFHSVGLKAHTEEVKQVRLNVFTNHYVVVIPIPAIPGLPPQNWQVRNLFAVRIPAVRLEREDDLRRLIGKVTEMEFVYPPFGDIMPKESFPILRTNTTPADLLAEYTRHMPWGFHLVVDEKRQELRPQQTDLAKAVTWVKQHLQRLLR